MIVSFVGKHTQLSSDLKLRCCRTAYFPFGMLTEIARDAVASLCVDYLRVRLLMCQNVVRLLSY